MTQRKYFGTDGVRGLYGGPLINEDFASRLGYAVATWLGRTGRIFVGTDTRASGESLARAISRGLNAAGAEAVQLGVVPTPAVARAVRTLGGALGVVITASHNPASDNGIKFFNASGIKLTDEQEAAIEALLPDGPRGEDRPLTHANARGDYLATVQALLPASALRGWRIVLDTANGATWETSPFVLRQLGAEVVSLGAAPDGHNINAHVGSEHPELLAQRVTAEHARLGIAHDGDGDRCVLCDERGSVLDGDEILTILATHALAQKKLPASTLVATVQSNLGVDAAINTAGGRVVRSSVGDRYVSEAMRATGATLGGESSGHVIFSEISTAGDGLVAALKVIEVMLATGRPLSELRTVLKKFPQKTSAIVAREKRPVDAMLTLRREIVALETELGARGRVLVRWSGTEPKLRLLIEGPTDTIVTHGLARLEMAARTDLA